MVVLVAEVVQDLVMAALEPEVLEILLLQTHLKVITEALELMALLELHLLAVVEALLRLGKLRQILQLVAMAAMVLHHPSQDLL
jgi:hypothetical protein